MTIWLASVVPRRIVRAATAFEFLVALAAGATTADAWRRASMTTLRTGYRLRDALRLAGPAIRTALLTRAPPPSVTSPSPDAQLVAHVRAALGEETSSFDRFHLAFQRPVLPWSRGHALIQ